MAGSPQFKVYNRWGEYVASCKEPEAAGVLASWYGEPSTIRWQHKYTVWTEGAEEQPAHESWDFVAETIQRRIAAINRQEWEKVQDERRDAILLQRQDIRANAAAVR